MGLSETLKKLGGFLEENNVGVEEMVDTSPQVGAEIFRGVMRKLSEDGDCTNFGTVLSEACERVSENEGADLEAVREEVVTVLEDALKQFRGED